MSLGAIRIRVSNDGMQATLESFEASTTTAEVLQVLATLGVNEGIDEAAIGAALSASETVNRVIASSRSLSQAVHFAGFKAATDFNEALSLLKAAQSLYKSGTQSAKEPFALYCDAGEEICIIDDLTDERSIQGTLLIEGEMRDMLDVDGERVAVELLEGALSYRAKIAGYPGISENRELTILPLTVPSADKMQLFVRVLPVQAGGAALLARIVADHRAFVATVGVPSAPCIDRLMFEDVQRGREAVELVAWKGREPVDGDDGRVLHLIEERGAGESDLAGNVDMKGFTSYREVHKGEIIADQILPTAGVAGYDVFGAELPAKDGKECAFRAGSNVLVAEERTVVHYKASINGVVHLKKELVEVTEELEIQGDAGVTTGNIRYSRDIIITGSVRSGYAVECGGQLTIGGVIEDKVRIKCSESAAIVQGVFGQESFVEVAGDLEVGFVQDSNLLIGGNLTVRGSVLNSHVTCRSAMTVEGVKLDPEQCSIMGGRIIAMKSLRAHSVGSYNVKTRLYCGFDPLLKEKEKQLQEAKKGLDALLVRLQNAIGFNLRDTHNLKRLALLSPQERRGVKLKLQKLQEVANRRNKIVSGLEKIQALIYAPAGTELFIQVDNAIVPDVRLQVGRAVQKIDRECKSLQFYLEKGSLLHRDAVWERS